MKRALVLLLASLVLFIPSFTASWAAPIAVSKSSVEQNDEFFVPVARFARGGAVRGMRGGAAARTRGYVGPRGGATARRTVSVRGPRGNVAVRSRATVVRPGWHGQGTRWARPARYWWRPGGAIAAGAAIGWVTAATAVAWAGAAPAVNMCWYYTDPGRTQGFWDVCP